MMVNSIWVTGTLLVLSIGLAISAILLDGTRKFYSLLKDGMTNHVYAYFAGCVSGIIVVPILTHIFRRAARSFLRRSEEAGNALYRLDHGILNVELPPRTMWMNMGYWKQASDFSTACQSLLDEVLKSAGLLQAHGSTLMFSNTTSLTLIDLGFGCGDQTIYLTQDLNSATTRPSADDINEKPVRYLFDNYVGLTISPSQFSFARDRLDSYPELVRSRVRLFCEDAAKPNSWGRDVHDAITNIPTKQQGTDAASSPVEQTTWILALDTLYHFSPSRKPIFCHAFEELHASIMAFDLLLSDEPSTWDLILLRTVSLFTATPFSNFLTVTQYKDQLMAAGYTSSQIEIQDISEHVFSGIASFIEKRDRELKIIGLGIGRYSVAGKVFGWWARSGIIRGCIVVAKK